MTISPGEGGTAGGSGLAVVVVNYESGDALYRCLESVRRQRPDAVVVVDNGSSDGSLDRVGADMPDVVVVRPAANLGYGVAANRGVSDTDSPYVLVANADLEVMPGAFGVLVGVLDDDPRCALVGPLLRTPTGDRYPSARRFPSLLDAAGHAVLGIVAPNNRFTRAYQRSDLDAAGSETHEVDWVSGACFCVRRTAFDEVGGFDASYFMYAEDVDLCWRLQRRGWRVSYAPAAEVVHAQGVSTERHPYRMIIEHHRSLWRFARRSQLGWRRLLLPVVAVGLGVRST
ncbi:MAG TPA: glycosyltransferase family 2 protein, partial [Acidimicrobiales bacterium]|nr:glycosyltransferase family 2 protein [Acidimicrobiales bacterium]